MKHCFLFFVINIACMFGSTSAYGEYGLKLNADAPLFEAVDVLGRKFSLGESLKKGPMVLVFYRGGWCPYCNTQLRSIQANLHPKLKKLGIELVAISVDKISNGLQSSKENQLGFTVVSDPEAKILKKYRLSHKLEPDLVQKYKDSYSIDIEGASGKKHHIIAIPGVFLISKQAKIVWRFVDSNYKVRAKNSDILKAAQSLHSKT